MRWFTLILIAPLLAAPTPTIKVTTRLVQINVLVHDHHGVPIEDLKKEDFELSDSGKPQIIRKACLRRSPKSFPASVMSWTVRSSTPRTRATTTWTRLSIHRTPSCRISTFVTGC